MIPRLDSHQSGSSTKTRGLPIKTFLLGSPAVHLWWTFTHSATIFFRCLKLSLVNFWSPHSPLHCGCQLCFLAIWHQCNNYTAQVKQWVLWCQTPKHFLLPTTKLELQRPIGLEVKQVQLLLLHLRYLLFQSDFSIFSHKKCVKRQIWSPSIYRPSFIALCFFKLLESFWKNQWNSVLWFLFISNPSIRLHVWQNKHLEKYTTAKIISVLFLIVALFLFIHSSMWWEPDGT